MPSGHQWNSGFINNPASEVGEQMVLDLDNAICVIATNQNVQSCKCPMVTNGTQGL